VAALPAELRTAELLTIGAQARAVAAFDVGDLAPFAQATVELRDLTASTHGWYSGYVSLTFSITRALLDGRWTEAEEQIALLGSHAGDDPNAIKVWAGYQFILLRDQGRHHELCGFVEGEVTSHPEIAGFRAALALLQAELGQLDVAATTFGPLAGDAVGGIPDDQTFAATLATVAEVAARIGDPESCAAAFDRMLQFRGRIAHVAGTITVGAGDRYLGMLSATLVRFDDAERHYDAALAIEERLGSRPYLTRTRTWYGRMLLERRAPGDEDRAAALLSVALTDADELGMVVVAAEIRGLLEVPRP
jgi:hypothetical protein